MSFRSPRREPRGTDGCHVIGHNLSLSWLSLPWQGSPAHTLPVTLTSLAWEDQIILHQYQIRFVQVSGLHLSAWFGGARIHESGCAWGLGKEAPGHHHTRASAKPPTQLLRIKALPYLDAPLPLGLPMAAAVPGWGWRLFCGRIGCFYKVLSAGKQQTATGAVLLQGCRAAGGEAFAPAASPATSSVPPPGTSAASPGPPATRHESWTPSLRKSQLPGSLGNPEREMTHPEKPPHEPWQCPNPAENSSGLEEDGPGATQDVAPLGTWHHSGHGTTQDMTPLRVGHRLHRVSPHTHCCPAVQEDEPAGTGATRAGGERQELGNTTTSFHPPGTTQLGAAAGRCHRRFG